MTTIFVICVLTLLAIQAYALDEATLNADDYLEKFGYLDGARRRSGLPQQRQLAKTRAIVEFQKFAHLPVTGQLDAQTRKKMIAPRCGFKDVRNRAAVSRWEKDDLTWALMKPTSQIDPGYVRMAIAQSLALWSKVIPLNFTEVHPDSSPDMKFGFSAGEHGDGQSNGFDGKGGVLAHAFFPQSGELHYDDQENWAFQDSQKIREGTHTDLLSVTIHEIGHALGLPHSDKEEAIMFPYYRSPEIDSNGNLVPFVLHQYDINDIREAYGPREGATRRTTPRPTPRPTPEPVATPRPTPRPTPEPVPPGGPTGAACPQFQATVTAMDGATYFFNGNVGLRKANANGPANSWTKFYLDKRFPGAPSSITAAVTDTDMGTFLFQGSRVYLYKWSQSTGKFTLEAGYPKEASFTPQGAFMMANNGNLVLTNGARFIFWDPIENKSHFDGALSDYFRGLPTSATASFNVGGDKLYLLNGANTFTVYDLAAEKVVSSQPMNALITC